MHREHGIYYVVYDSNYECTPASECTETSTSVSIHGNFSVAQISKYVRTVDLGYNELYIPLRGFVTTRDSLRPNRAKPKGV